MTSRCALAPRISVIIPTLNEEAFLVRAIESVAFDAEVLVVDGGSRDRTVEMARQKNVAVLTGRRGRAVQMNAGASKASGDVLVFLHADTVLPKGADALLENALVDPEVVGGFFELAIDSRRLPLRVVAWGSNLRARLLGLPYGDQALFVRRKAFETLGGFREMPLMEDVEFVRRLKRLGPLACVGKAVTTSARHWERRGALLTTVINWTAALLYALGVSAAWLAPRYHRLRGDRYLATS